MPIISPHSGKDERKALFPPALLPAFDDVFVESFDLCEEYVARMALSVFKSTGLDHACREKASVEQAIARAGLALETARVPVAWLLSMMTGRGWLAKSRGADGAALYRLEHPPPILDPDDTLRAQERLDARCLPSYRIVALAAEHYPAVLRGQTTGEQALFGPEGVVPWVKYFSNGNPLYAISNAVGAIAAAQALAGKDAAILEIGGGLGSGADALLDRLESLAQPLPMPTYRFTDISPLFLKRAQRTLAARHPACPFVFAPLDIDRPFAAQGIEAATYSLVYGVNVLHVARDLAATLAELKQALRPRGMLVMSECVRPFAGMPMPLEFVFNLLGSFRNPVLVPGWRPNGGFLTPEQWTAALECNGFADVRVFPDIAAIRDTYSNVSVAAIVARRR